MLIKQKQKVKRVKHHFLRIKPLLKMDCEDTIFCLCNDVGEKALANTKSKKTLEQRWATEYDQEVLKNHYKHFFHFGQNLTMTSIPKAANTLLKRDYQHIFDFPRKKMALGAIRIPDSYLPVCPQIQNLDRGQMMLSTKEMSPEYKNKLENSRIRAVGDMAERSVYDVLKEFFNDDKTKTVLIIQSVNMLNINPYQRLRKYGKHHREMDFLIVHHDLGLIVNIEVKNSLTNESMKKVQYQLQENHKFFTDWFANDIDPKWNYIAMVYIEQDLKEPMKRCSKPCAVFGKVDLKETLERIFRQTSFSKEIPANDFQFMAKYLLFSCQAIPLPFGKRFDKAVRTNIVKQGCEQNIRTWCFPTPAQKTVLNHSKVLFLSTFGTGKTLLMVRKALELAEQGEKVIFLIFKKSDMYTMNTLLYVVLDQEFEKKNIALKQINFVDGSDHGLVKLTEDYDHIFIDEFFDDFYMLESSSRNDFFHAICNKKTVWIAFSGTYNSNPLSKEDLPTISQKAAKWIPIPNMKIVQIKIPLRSPKFVPLAIKKAMEKRTDMDLNNLLMLDIQLPPTLTDGKETRINVHQLSSLTDILRQCLTQVPKGTYGLIIVEDFAYNFPERHISCACKENLFKLLFGSVFKDLGKPPPLFYTRTNESPKKDIDKWLKKEHNWLITTYRLAMGFTSSFIINLGTLEATTRCSGQLIQIDEGVHWPLATLPLILHCKSHKGGCGLTMPTMDEPYKNIGMNVHNTF